MTCVLPNKLIYLATPRTGSIATVSALQRSFSAETYGLKHHSYLSEVQSKAPVTGEEITVTGVRNIFDLLGSWFDLNPEWDDFEKFICEYEYEPYLIDCIYIHHPVDYELRFHCLNEDLTNLCNNLDLGEVELKHKNTTPKKHDYRRYYNDHIIELVHQRFCHELLDPDHWAWRFEINV